MAKKMRTKTNLTLENGFVIRDAPIAKLTFYGFPDSRAKSRAELYLNNEETIRELFKIGVKKNA